MPPVVTPDALRKLAELDRIIKGSSMQWIDGNLDAKLEFVKDAKDRLNEGEDKRLDELQSIIGLVREVSPMLNLPCGIRVSGQAGWQKTQDAFERNVGESGEKWKKLATDRAKFIAEILKVDVDYANCRAANAKRVVIHGLAEIKQVIESSSKQLQMVNVLQRVLSEFDVEEGKEGKELHLKHFKLGLPLRRIWLDDKGLPLIRKDVDNPLALKNACTFVEESGGDPAYKLEDVEEPVVHGSAPGASSGARSQPGQPIRRPKSSGGARLERLAPESKTTQNSSHSVKPRFPDDLVNPKDPRVHNLPKAMEALVDLVECGFVGDQSASSLHVQGYTLSGDIKNPTQARKVLQLQDLREQVAVGLLKRMADIQGKESASFKFQNFLSEIKEERQTRRGDMRHHIKQKNEGGQDFAGAVVYVSLSPHGQELVASLKRRS